MTGEVRVTMHGRRCVVAFQDGRVVTVRTLGPSGRKIWPIAGRTRPGPLAEEMIVCALYRVAERGRDAPLSVAWLAHEGECYAVTFRGRGANPETVARIDGFDRWTLLWRHAADGPPDARIFGLIWAAMPLPHHAVAP